MTTLAEMLAADMGAPGTLRRAATSSCALTIFIGTSSHWSFIRLTMMTLIIIIQVHLLRICVFRLRIDLFFVATFVTTLSILVVAFVHRLAIARLVGALLTTILTDRVPRRPIMVVMVIV